MSANPLIFPEERRLATVLFADVQGFTALAEQLDFETVSDLIKGIWERLDKAIENHTGFIDKHLGDGVMAIWGAPFAGENDAEQAVLAGLDLIKALDEYCESSGIRGAEKLKLRVGVNTGQVFAGYVGTRREYTVLGDTVNVASRLEQIAEAGTVVIGENTLRMVAGGFRVHRLEPTAAKGKTELVQPYRVEGRLLFPAVDQGQGSDLIISKMVGREDEFNKLKLIYDRCFPHTTGSFAEPRSAPKQGIKPAMVILNGDVGIGKTRLSAEFINFLVNLSDINVIISTRGLVKTSKEPFSMWRLLLLNCFGILDDDPAQASHKKWTQGFERIWIGDDTQAEKTEVMLQLGKVAGLSDSWNNPDTGIEQELSESASSFKENYTDDDKYLQGIFCAIHKLLSLLGKNRNLILLFDDLQFADRESLQLLASIITTDKTPIRIMIIGGARPEFLKTNTQWHNIARVINLNPLDLTTEMVSRAYPHLRILPESLLNEIGQHAEGNPYFLGEIIKSLLKGSLHENIVDPQAVREQLSSQIPEPLRATLQARMDNLSREARTAALLASVVGRVFWVGAVLAAARSTPLPGATPLIKVPETVIDRFIQGGLRQMVLADLAFPRSGSKFSDGQEYFFKNSYLRDVAYSLIPNRNRVQYHKAVAEWMTQFDDSAFQSMAREHEHKAETSAKISLGDLSKTKPQK